MKIESFLDKLPFKCNLYWTNYITFKGHHFQQKFSAVYVFLIDNIFLIDICQICINYSQFQGCCDRYTSNAYTDQSATLLFASSRSSSPFLCSSRFYFDQWPLAVAGQQTLPIPWIEQNTCLVIMMSWLSWWSNYHDDPNIIMS